MSLLFITSFLNGLFLTGGIGVLLNFGVALHYFRKNRIRFEVKDWKIFMPTLYFFIFILLVGVARLLIG